MARLNDEKREIKSQHSERLNNRDKKARDLKLKEARRNKEIKRYC